MKVYLYSYAGLAVFAVSAWASVMPARRAMAVVEERAEPPSGFASLGTPTTDMVVTLRVGLAAENLPGLEAALYDVSTPGSAQYGQYLSQDEVCSFFDVFKRKYLTDSATPGQIFCRPYV